MLRTAQRQWYDSWHLAVLVDTNLLKEQMKAVLVGRWNPLKGWCHSLKDERRTFSQKAHAN